VKLNIETLLLNGINLQYSSMIIFKHSIYEVSIVSSYVLVILYHASPCNLYESIFYLF